MTRAEFKELGTDIFSEYLPKVKASERNMVLDAFLDELEASGALDIEEESVPDTDPDALFDSYGDED